MVDIVFLIIYVITEVVNELLAYTILFQAKLTRKVKNIVFVLVGLVLFHIIVYWGVGIEVALGIPMFSMLVIPALLLKQREKKWFLLYPVIVMGISIISVGSSFLVAMIIDVPEYLLVTDVKIGCVWQFVPTIILVIFFFYQKDKEYNNIEMHISAKQYCVIYIGVGCAFIALAMMQEVTEEDLVKNMKNAYGFATSLISMVFVLMSLWQGIIVNREKHYKKQNELYEVYIKQQEEQIRAIIEQDEKIRRFRHDMNAHFIAMKSYCEGKEDEKLKSYLENVVENSGLYKVKSYTGNSAVDAVIRHFEEEAEAKGIVMNFEGTLAKSMKISEFDLCTILSNLMKNAIEACEKIQDKENRIIEVKIGTYDLNLYINVVNPVEKEVIVQNNELLTTKDDKRNHGLGSGNVKNTVKKLGGSVEYECKNGYFKVEILM